MKKSKKKDKDILNEREKSSLQKLQNHLERFPKTKSVESLNRHIVLKTYVDLLENSLSLPTKTEVAFASGLSVPTVSKHLSLLNEQLSDDEAFMSPLKSLLLNQIMKLSLSDRPCIKALRLGAEILKLNDTSQTSQQFNQQVIYHVSGEDDD